MARSARLKRRLVLVGLPDNQLRPSPPRETSPARRPPGPATSLDRYSRQSHGTKKHRDLPRWADPFLCSNAELVIRTPPAAQFLFGLPINRALRASLRLHATRARATSSLLDAASHQRTAKDVRRAAAWLHRRDLIPGSARLRAARERNQRRHYSEAYPRVCRQRLPEAEPC